MPTSNNSALTFSKHPACRLQAYDTSKNTAPLAPVRIGNLHYIIYQSQLISLPLLFDTIGAGQHFCVCSSPEQISHNDNAEQLPEGLFQVLSAGSTQAPKKIRRSAQSWINSFDTNAELFSISPVDRYAVVGQLTHSLPLYACLEAAHLGAEIHALAELRLKKQLKMLIEWQSTVLYITPTQLQSFAHQLSNTHTLAPSIRLIMCGGGKLQAKTKTLAQRQFPNATIREFYGAAETSFITLSDETTPYNSVGRAYPGVDIMVCTKNLTLASQAKNPVHTKASAQANVHGELLVSSPYLYHSYGPNKPKNLPQAHTERPNVLTNKPRFVRTGEIGYIDSLGYVYITGRRDRMINIADQNVYPEPIEHFISDMSGIKHCVVVARINKKKGHTLTAVIEVDPNEYPDSTSIGTLKRHILSLCRETFGALSTPKTVLTLSPLPQLASAKPDIQRVIAWVNRNQAIELSTGADKRHG